jgi:hypothetical protein
MKNIKDLSLDALLNVIFMETAVNGETLGHQDKTILKLDILALNVQGHILNQKTKPLLI